MTDAGERLLAGARQALDFAMGKAAPGTYKVHYPAAKAVVIRRECSADFRRIYDLTASAFGRACEAELLDRLRADDALLLSHVAEIDGEIVGQAAYSLVSIHDGDRVHRQPALGPIAVAPAYQRRGIGSALVRAGLEAMSEAGYAMLFLVGHVSYYPRFGFAPAQPLGFSSDYVQPGGAHEHFMAAVLDERQSRTLRGAVKFHPAFDDV